MATEFLLPLWVANAYLGLFLALLLAFAYMFFWFFRKDHTDKVMIIDESNRWRIVSQNLRGDKFQDGKLTYNLVDKAGILNRKGKKLFIFSQNNPVPLSLEYKKASWLDSKTLYSTINNSLISQMATPSNPTRDIVIMLGAIMSMVSAVMVAVILARQFGMI